MRVLPLLLAPLSIGAVALMLLLHQGTIFEYRAPDGAIYTLGSRRVEPGPAALTGDAVPAPAVVPSSDYRYDAPPSISRDTYIAVFCSAGSAACDEAGNMYDLLVAYGIDPAVEAGQAWHETNRGLAGVGVASIKNLHGVQCHGGDNRIGDSAVPWGNGCAGIYANYTTSVDTWARLILREYIPEGRNTPATVVAKYAPAGADGNHPPAYIATMQGYIDSIRALDAALQASSAPGIPAGNPICGPLPAVMTQGYGIGSHAPVEIWGGVDLAVDENGDGRADPGVTQGAPVCATHGGTVEAKAGTWPGGNCILLHSSTHRTTYCHLDAFAVADGAVVQRGDLIAFVGSTGNSTGPHLHYEVWEGPVNLDPCAFGAPC